MTTANSNAEFQAWCEKEGVVFMVALDRNRSPWRQPVFPPPDINFQRILPALECIEFYSSIRWTSFAKRSSAWIRAGIISVAFPAKISFKWRRVAGFFTSVTLNSQRPQEASRHSGSLITMNFLIHPLHSTLLAPPVCCRPYSPSIWLYRSA